MALAGVPDGGASKDWTNQALATCSGNFINEAAVDDLREFIAECKRAGTTLVVFLPPLYPPALDFLRNHPDSAGFWNIFPERVRGICQAEGIPLNDYTDAADLQTAAGNFFDWYHGSEKLYGRLLLKMCDDPATAAILSRYVDRADLKRTVESAGSQFFLYGD
jgi:hypothetical protein